MKYHKILTVIIFAVAMSACNRDEIFEREQYKHVISLISERDGVFNIFNEEHDPANYGDEEGFTDGYISASVGGSLITDLPVNITLVEDASLLQEYNNSNFTLESYRYARYLPANRYIIDHHVISIPAGERLGKMKIRVRVGGLSPDSLYFIPLRVDKYSTYELNAQKNTVLYRVHLKNFWASTAASQITYAHRGLKYDEGTDEPAPTIMNKHVHPVSGNAVRIFAGNTPFSSAFEDIEAWAILLTMDDDGKVTISPYASGRYAINVTPIDGDEEYPNVFKLIDDGWGNFYKTFLLYYEYVDPTNNITYRMKEELRIAHQITVM